MRKYYEPTQMTAATFRTAVVAATLYLLGALWYLHVVLPAPASLLPLTSQGTNLVGEGDQEMVVATISHVARTLLTDPQRLYEGAQCFPAPAALTLGDHMIGDGVLGLAPYWLSGGEPILTANVVVLLGVWIAGIAMYAWVLYWTGSAGPAFVAGLLFAFLPTRLLDPGHPFVHANHWTPLVLLYLHRTFVRTRWRDAAGLALFVGLQLLESFYQVWAMTVLVLVYGAALSALHWRRLPAVLPKLLVSVAATGALAAVVMTPYLRTGTTWGVLSGRFSFLSAITEFTPGHSAYPGTMVLVLAALALVDRLRHRRAPEDPRLPLLVAGLVMLWAVVAAVRLPLLDVVVPSLTYLAAAVVPGLGAVRGLVAARSGVYVVTTFLAGYGLFVLTAGRGRLLQQGTIAITAVAAMLGVFHPPWAEQQFGMSPTLVARAARPSTALLALYRQLPPGAVLDVPFVGGLRELRDQSHYALMGAYHHQPVAGCYNSYRLPVHDDLVTLASHFPSAAMIDAIAALGFRSVVLHGEGLRSGMAEGLRAGVALLEQRGQLRRIGDADDHTAYAIAHVGQSLPGPFCLSVSHDVAPEVEVAPPTTNLEFEFHDLIPVACRHPSPLRPTRLVARWTSASGESVTEEHVSALLPIVVEAGGSMTRAVPLHVPAEGSYEVALSVEDTPALVVARRPVKVSAAVAALRP